MLPRTRLILWTAFIVLPFSVLAAASNEIFHASTAIIGLFLAVVIGDALLGMRGLHGLRVVLPPLTRMQKDRPGELEVHIENEPAAERLVRVGPGFPPAVVPAEEDRVIRLPAAASARILWPCTPRQRGQYWVKEIALEAVSPLGFWAFRTRQKCMAELRVYPNLLEDRRHVAALFLRRGRIGAHAQRSAGHGREFEKLREYLPGDSLAEIHWKASARRGAPVTKAFQVERTHEVYVLVDASRLAARQVDELGGPTAMERYVTAALLLALAAEQQGDQFGLITFSDRIHTFMRARSGAAHVDACRDRLYGLQPHDVSPDFEELFALVRLRLRKRALLIVLTALDDPVLAESFVKATDLVSRQHLLLVNMLRPPGVRPLFTDPAPVQKIDEIYTALAGHLQWHKLRELQLVLQHRAVRLSFVDPVKLPAELIAQHAEARMRSLV